jgi:hypothetical protein
MRRAGRALPALIAALALLTATGALASPALADAPQIGHLVAYIPGDGSVTEVVNDVTGALVGSATFSPGRRDQAFSFDGSAGAVQLPAAAWQYPAADFSVVAWVKTSVTSGHQVIVEEYECGNFCPNNDASSGWALGVMDGAVYGWVRQAQVAGDGQYLTGADVANGLWHQLGFVRDTQAGKALLYIDGALNTSADLNDEAVGPLANDDGDDDPITIGAHVVGGQTALDNEFTGLIDEVGFYDTALSAAEMATIASLAPSGLRLDNVGPTAVDDTATVNQDSTANTIDVLANDSDPNDDPLKIVGNTAAAHGTATCLDTACSYTPDAGFSGTDSFSYDATDGDGTTASATVTLTVSAATPSPGPTLTPAPTATAGPTASSAPTASPEQPAGGGGGPDSAVLIAIVGALLVVLALLVIWLARRRQARPPA